MTKIGLDSLSCNNGRYYVGSTNDLERRLSEHDRGMVKSTKSIVPIKLVFFKELKKSKQARQVEYNLKRQKIRKIIETITKDNVIKLMGD